MTRLRSGSLLIIFTHHLLPTRFSRALRRPARCGPQIARFLMSSNCRGLRRSKLLIFPKERTDEISLRRKHMFRHRNGSWYCRVRAAASSPRVRHRHPQPHSRPVLKSNPIARRPKRLKGLNKSQSSAACRAKPITAGLGTPAKAEQQAPASAPATNSCWSTRPWRMHPAQARLAQPRLAPAEALQENRPEQPVRPRR